MMYTIDLLGTMVFAISGSMAANRQRINIIGAGFTGFVTAIGGGSLRDLFLNLRPVWVDDSNYIFIILLGVALSMVGNKFLNNLARTLTFFDALGIGFFCIVGVQKSLQYESTAVAAVILGMFSAVMGGVTRDTLLNELPLIFRKEIYATACLAGALMFVVLQNLNVPNSINAWVSAMVVVFLRLLAVRYQLTLPSIDEKIK
ncbi:MAG TPA: trimeric intracellular cation channel family protein [Sphingobacterium sp.]|nr:trimeric intracellular cation channel family protein [Sphingobacterium sp.]